MMGHGGNPDFGIQIEIEYGVGKSTNGTLPQTVGPFRKQMWGVLNDRDSGLDFLS